ncbi:MAG: NAD(P)-binding domain-containing protein [Armatimonadetes bacterium]|nr:NAD(P)-binding domain-containing protein [Armatimonadota bacterium]
MERTDLVIVGAGPLGLELAAAVRRAGLDYLHFEAGQIGSTIAWWPPRTRFFSAPERVAIAGVPLHTPGQDRPLGEDYLAYLRQVVEQLDLPVRTYERVTDLRPTDDGFRLTTVNRTGSHAVCCRRVVIATGDMARPNKLGIPGEDLPHVSHYLSDPHLYFRQRLLVVGGGNSALEAVLRCWRAGARVTLSYRRETLQPRQIKSWLAPEVMMLIEKGKVEFLPATRPVAIEATEVRLAPHPTDSANANHLRRPADFVLLMTGYRADLTLLQGAGVELQGEQEVPRHDPQTMETNVPGLYVAGTVAGGNQHDYQLFIETCHVHVERIAAALGLERPATGGEESRNYPFQLGDNEPKGWQP